MPTYIYRCRLCNHEAEIIHTFFECDLPHLCDKCGGKMHRVPQSTAVNWDGLKPSGGELAPEVQRHIDNIDEYRDNFTRIHEEHEAQKHDNN